MNSKLNEQTIDERCAYWAAEGLRAGKWLDHWRNRGKWISHADYRYVAGVADRIIALRTQQAQAQQVTS